MPTRLSGSAPESDTHWSAAGRRRTSRIRPTASGKERAAVASLSWRAVASLAAGSMIRATIMARISLARRSGPPCRARAGAPSRAPRRRGRAPARGRSRSARLRAAAGLAGEHPAQAVDLRLRPIGDVGERARLDLAALAIALAQEHGGRRITVWDARDVHP